VYIDSCVYIDLLAKNKDKHPDTGEPRWRSAHALFSAVDQRQVRLAASSLVEAEVLTKPVFRMRDGGVQEQVRQRFRAATVVWSDVDRFLVQDAEKLAAEYYLKVQKQSGMGAADALHLAAAVRLGCDYLFTQDAGFPIGETVQRVKIKYPSVVWQEFLND
jgi:predicted nucleic acid-binding protein